MPSVNPQPWKRETPPFARQLRQGRMKGCSTDFGYHVSDVTDHWRSSTSSNIITPRVQSASENHKLYYMSPCFCTHFLHYNTDCLYTCLICNIWKEFETITPEWLMISDYMTLTEKSHFRFLLGEREKKVRKPFVNGCHWEGILWLLESA